MMVQVERAAQISSVNRSEKFYVSTFFEDPVYFEQLTYRNFKEQRRFRLYLMCIAVRSKDEREEAQGMSAQAGQHSDGRSW